MSLVSLLKPRDSQEASHKSLHIFAECSEYSVSDDVGSVVVGTANVL